MKRQEIKLEEKTVSLEGCISRSREHQESIITTTKEEHVKFQKEMRCAISGLQSTQMASINDKTPREKCLLWGIQSFEGLVSLRREKVATRVDLFSGTKTMA